MIYKTNREEEIMKTTHETNVRIKGNRGRCGASGLVLAVLLAFGFAMPAHGFVMPLGAAAEGALEAQYDMGVTLATIRVPVKLHHLPDSYFYFVTCDVYDRPHGSLRKRGGNVNSGTGTTNASGDANTTIVVVVHPLKNISNPLPLVTWLCHLNINFKGVGLTSGSRLSTMAKKGTRFKGNVGGSF